MSLLSQQVHLVVNKPVAEFSDIEVYLVEELVATWKRQHDQITNESFRGNVRLEQYLSDNRITREQMSEDLRNRTAYGMTLAF